MIVGSSVWASWARPAHTTCSRHGVSSMCMRAEQMRALVVADVMPHDSPAALAAHCDIIFTNVSDAPDVQQVELGEHGIIHAAKPGSVVVDIRSKESYRFWINR
ncbi:MAG TPA: NAD(P)-binding domain-containing protein [Gallionellaceae bacterium]|nr:NAD(P)-binding domain-containing protein [Gallionellaceae bacterium]